ncbi:RimK/LysX family protein [Psychromonas aquimarina]|uniref:putative ATP-dependent zinc protease n=1 Tax=Psychromonas aquimarina TaxID=444919 RepID=UPI0003FB0355|nr:RimK/LysX family protein [Psychromonas aquimarina]
MIKRILTTFTALLLCSTAGAEIIAGQTSYQVDDKPVLGRLENIYYNDVAELSAIPFTGKIDTGAETTSMHADNIVVTSQNEKYKGLKTNELLETIVYELGGPKERLDKDHFTSTEKNIQATVEFTVANPYTGEDITITRPLFNISSIRSRSSPEPIFRPVIEMALSIGGHKITTPVNLTDRSVFSAPFLVGKSYLQGNAWVLAGYDYFQTQEESQIIGRKERLSVLDIPVNVSMSMHNRYSILNAANVKVDQKNSTVNFDLVGSNNKKKNMQLPIVRMLNFRDYSTPLVYVPIEAANGFKQHILVYLKDRSKSSSQLRLGRKSLSKFFMIDPSRQYLLAEKTEKFNSKTTEVISAKEDMLFENIKLSAEPSFAAKTSKLLVEKFELLEKQSKVKITIKKDGLQQEIVKPVEKIIVVGEERRPVIEGDVQLNANPFKLQLALEVKENAEQPDILLGRSFFSDKRVLNVRSENILTAHAPVKAGFIEVVQLGKLAFPAKLDTGADVSSMNAVNIQRFKDKGKDMVTFTYENKLGTKKEFTKEVAGVMRVKAKAGEKANERPIVIMDVTLNGETKKVRVNLQDRSRFDYSMILGKNFLADDYYVSSEHIYLIEK